MKIAEIFCTVTKAARISNFNPVMQISQCLQNTASCVYGDGLIGRCTALRTKLQKLYEPGANNQLSNF